MQILVESHDQCQRIPPYLFPVKMYFSGLMLLSVMSLHLGMSLIIGIYSLDIAIWQLNLSCQAFSLCFICSYILNLVSVLLTQAWLSGQSFLATP